MSLGKKNILVSYLERQISENIKGYDIDCLSELKKVFAFGSNVNILLTFQKVDQDWSEYVDLDKDSVLS